jgi:hypothetical protein
MESVIVSDFGVMLGKTSNRLVVRGPRPRLELAEDRAPAFYGDEERDIPASELFDESDARRATSVADRFLDLHRRLLGEQGEPGR